MKNCKDNQEAVLPEMLFLLTEQKTLNYSVVFDKEVPCLATG
jgi:hypothetical protein